MMDSKLFFMLYNFFLFANYLDKKNAKEVMGWVVSSRNEGKKCASINTGSCWPVRGTSEGRADK